jgi:hypothetical protein
VIGRILVAVGLLRAVVVRIKRAVAVRRQGYYIPAYDDDLPKGSVTYRSREK